MWSTPLLVELPVCMHPCMLQTNLKRYLTIVVSSEKGMRRTLLRPNFLSHHEIGRLKTLTFQWRHFYLYHNLHFLLVFL